LAVPPPPPPRALGSLFVASYSFQGCGGGILTRLHTGIYVQIPDDVRTNVNVKFMQNHDLFWLADRATGNALRRRIQYEWRSRLRSEYGLVYSTRGNTHIHCLEHVTNNRYPDPLYRLPFEMHRRFCHHSVPALITAVSRHDE
jgi:hypothetical protein